MMNRDDKAKYIDEYALIYGNIQHDMQYKFISFHFLRYKIRYKKALLMGSQQYDDIHLYSAFSSNKQ